MIFLLLMITLGSPVEAALVFSGVPLALTGGVVALLLRGIPAVLIDRNPETRVRNPIDQMVEAIDADDSLILFPEGTRNLSEQRLLPFKPGLWHVGRRRPALDLIPVWIDNLNRVLPKGEAIPVPLLCTVRFGAALHVADGEECDAFLARAREALLELAPEEEEA